MKSKLAFAIAVTAAVIAGVISGHLICRSVPCRHALGLLCKRGELLALVHGAGIYESDVEAQPLPKLMANAALNFSATSEVIATSVIDRECNLLETQFRDRATWLAALRANCLSRRALRSRIANNLRAEKRLDRQLSAATKVSDDECRKYFDANPSQFAQPLRFRVSHLFLAAPPETAPEIVDVKKRTIDAISERIANGEKLADLVATISEDEATKKQGGDLNFFSENRMPPDFAAAVKNLRIGEPSKVVRTKLGFHILRLTDTRPARPMSFDEAKGEIAVALENEKRANFVAELATAYAGQAEFIRTGY